MMKIEKLLTISGKVINGKETEVARVQDFDDKDRKKIDKSKFEKGKSTRGVERLEARCLVILKEDFENYEKESQSQMQTLKDEIGEKNKEIEMLQNKLSDIDEKHQKEMDKIKDEYSEEIEQLKADLHEKDLEIERTKTKSEEEKGDLKEKYQEEIGIFREKIQKEINGLELFDEDKHMLIKDHQADVLELRKNQFNSEYHMNITDHQKKISGIKDKIVRETIQYNDKISELEKSLSLSGYIRGHHKSKIKELKEGIDDFKLIAQYIESQENELLQDVKKGEGQN